MDGGTRSNNYGALSHVDMDTVVQRVAAGEFPAHIARELGVSRVALHYKLRVHPQYQEALEAGTSYLLDDGFEQLQAAGDDLNLARAREIQLRRLEWRAERLFPHKWGQRSHITYENVTDLADALARAEERRERDITHDAPQQLDDSASIIEGDS